MAIEQPANTNSANTVDSALRWIGDLDHPFYNDERQRFIWYEASAIGFQLLLMLQFTVSGIVLLIAGRPALAYVGITLVPAILTTLVVAGYSHKKGAMYFVQSSDVRRGRGLLAVGAALLLAAGILRASMQAVDGSFDSEFGWSTLAGLITGAAAALVVGLLIQRKFFNAQESAVEED